MTELTGSGEAVGEVRDERRAVSQALGLSRLRHGRRRAAPPSHLPACRSDRSRLTEEAKVQFSPAAHLKENAAAVPPLFVARAGLDPNINQSIDRFIAEALAANVPLDLMNHPQGRHAFDILDDDPRTREILARTVQFVKAHLEPAGT